MKKISLFIIIFLVSSLLQGCWDKVELEDYGYVAVVGIDSEKDNKLRFTFQIANPQVGSLVQSQVNEPPSEVHSIPAIDIEGAKELASSTITRRLTLTHAKAIVISEDVAMKDDFFQLLTGPERDPDVRDEINIIVCRERAEDFIKNNRPPLETRPSKYYTFMTSRWQESGLVPFATLERFMQRNTDGLSGFLAIYATTRQLTPKEEAENDSDYTAGQVNARGGNPTQMIGSAFIKDGKMVGKLTGSETKIALLLRPQRKIKRIGISVPDPEKSGYRVSGRLSASTHPKIKMNLNKTVPEVQVSVPVSFDVLNIPSFVNYVTDVEKQKLLKASIEKYLNSEAEELVRRTQQQFKIDPFEWGKEAKKYFSTNDEFKDFDWRKNYPSMKVTVNFHVKLGNFGKQKQPLELQKMESN